MFLVELTFGLFLLVAGAELLVRGAVAIARRLGISTLVVGLTVVGFGTSLPELVTSVQAALVGAPGIAVGNVIGSNIANILLILGITACVAPVAVTRTAFLRDGGALSIATVICALFILTGVVGRIEGIVLVAALAGYLGFTFIRERGADEEAQDPKEGEALPGEGLSLGLAVLLAVVGIACTVGGARFFVLGAIDVADLFDVPETVVGLTVVALGTSLPELVTCVVAALKREGDIAFGNVLGSNIFNVLGILGVTALVHPLAIPDRVLALDLWIMAGSTVALLILAFTGWRITRAEGALLAAAYATYTAIIL